MADTFLDRLHRRAVQNGTLQLFTVVVRVVLVVAFVQAGLIKLLGARFTTLPPTTPVGGFFDAFFQVHLLSSVIAGAVAVVLAGAALHLYFRRRRAEPRAEAVGA